MEQVYTEYFAKQAGAGRSSSSVGPVYQASFSRQNGRGCCGLTGRYVTAVATPLLAKSIRALGEEAAAAGFGFYNDLTEAKAPLTFRDVRKAAVSRLAEAGRNLKRRAKRTLTGRGAKARPPKRRKAAKRKTTKRKKAKRKPARRGTKRSRPRKSSQTGRGHSAAHTQPFDIFS